MPETSAILSQTCEAPGLRVPFCDASDRELAERLKQGDDRAYEHLVRTCGPQVLAVSRRYMRSEADAEDCFQETFIAVTDSIDTFTGQSSLRRWVRGIAVNKCLMALRKRGRKAEESIEHLLPQFDETGRRIGATGGQRETAVESQLDTQQLRRAVRSHIQDLPDDYRTVILLRDIDGYDTRETAEILGIKTNAVKTRLHRARAALKAKIELLMTGDRKC